MSQRYVPVCKGAAANGANRGYACQRLLTAARRRCIFCGLTRSESQREADAYARYVWQQQQQHAHQVAYYYRR